mgnify:CR=1 FL=1
MRRILVISIMFLAALSCSRIEKPLVHEIGFDEPSVDIPTRTTPLITGPGQMGTTGISVFASKSVGVDGTMFMNNVKVYKKGDVWAYDDYKYHWSPGASHKFFGIYPYCDPSAAPLTYKVNTTSRAIEVYGKAKDDTETGYHPIKTGVEEGGCPDILFSVVSYDEPFDLMSDPGPVVFNMRHAGAVVTLNVINKSDYVITGISGSLKGAPAVDPATVLPGLYDTAQKVVIDTESSTPVVWEYLGLGNGSFVFHHDNLNLAVGSTHAQAFQEIVIPQNINAVAPDTKDKLYLHFSVTFNGNSDPSSYTICLADIPLTGQKPEYLKTWLPGKNYVYNLNITSDYITCGVSVVDWVEDDMIDLN